MARNSMLGRIILCGLCFVALTAQDDSGCSTETDPEPATKKPAKPKRPPYLPAFERAVRQNERGHYLLKGVDAEVEVRCEDTKVPRGKQLASACYVRSFASPTGNLEDAEELPERAYEVRYDPKRPSRYKLLPP